MSEEIRLSQRRVDVERLAQDVVIDAGRDPSYQDGVLVIPIHEEVPLTALRLVPNELVQVR